MKDQKKTIIFLHGKQSTPEGSGSGKAIREHFSKEYNVLIPDYKPMERTHKEIETYLKEFISPHPEALIVGISLGGYWAYRMACVLPIDLGLSCVLLNPYFYNYPEIEVPMPPTNIPITVVVNMDDDLINPQEVIKRFQDTATIRAFETGGHRFKDKTPIVREVATALRNYA
ncbi:hypothetical protein DSECCO2_392220 [anaerobic digester metagenome]